MSCLGEVWNCHVSQSVSSLRCLKCGSRKQYQVTDEAVLLHAHPSSIEATVGCVQFRSQVRDELPLLVKGFKENAVGHLGLIP